MGMAWCPQCKNEYREGITVCVDCGCDLVAEEQYDDLTPLTFGDEAQMNVLKKFLDFNKLKGVTVMLDEESEDYVIYVREGDKSTAAKLSRVFYEQEMLRRQEAMEAAGSEMFTAGDSEMCGDKDDEEAKQEDIRTRLYRASREAATVYQNSSERAEDNRSSAWTLMIVGGIGLIAMILCITGVIPLRLGNPYMFYGVMSAVFLLFIVMGVVSMKNAKLFAKKAESENTLKDAMVKWYQENLSASKIDEGLVGEDEEVPEEILYFKRVQKIKDMFNHQFMNLDQVFLEHFVDEEVYDAIYEEE